MAVSALRSKEDAPCDRLSTYLLEAAVEVVARVVPRVAGVVDVLVRPLVAGGGLVRIRTGLDWAGLRLA